MHEIVLKLDDEEFNRASVLSRFYTVRLAASTGLDASELRSCTPEELIRFGLFDRYSNVDLSCLKDEKKIRRMLDYLHGIGKE